MCKVIIPSSTKSCTNEELKRCIEFASARSGLEDFKLAEAMTYLLEAIADENTRGRAVKIPGFGIFAPVPDGRPVERHGLPRCRVRFLPSRGYAEQVRWGAPPQESMRKRYHSYRRNHHPHDGKFGSPRVFTAMKYFRSGLSKQMAHVRDD